MNVMKGVPQGLHPGVPDRLGGKTLHARTPTSRRRTAMPCFPNAKEQKTNAESLEPVCAR